MPERTLGKDINQKLIQTDIHGKTQNENKRQLIEMAAEQLAVLLWKTWLHKKNAEDKENKMKNHPRRLSTAF
jgi:hypothetical protein